MTTVAQLHKTAQRVLIDAANAVARTTHFTQRTSKLTGPAFVQTLVIGWLAHPEATLEELAQTAAALGVEISPQGLDERFTPEAAAFLQAVLQRAVRERVEGTPVPLDLLDRFRGVYLIDASQVTLPAALGEVWRGNSRVDPERRTEATEAAVKLTVGFDLSQGQLIGPDLTDGREPDRNADLVATVWPKGAMRVADLGYFSLAELARLNRMDVYWLSRFQTKCGFFDRQGQAWELDAFLAAQTTDRIDVPIQLGLTIRLPCRLLAVRVPPEVAEGRRRKLRERAKGRGGTPSRKELALCDWTVFVTNAPERLLSLPEALVLGRLRWQIELVFKLWKSQLRVDEWRTHNPWRILCEVYAKLLGALLQHWILVVTGWDLPDRSLVKATRTIRNYVRSLALALGDPIDWAAVLAVIHRCLRHGCRLNKRRKHPSSYQLVFNSERLGLA